MKVEVEPRRAPAVRAPAERSPARPARPRRPPRARPVQAEPKVDPRIAARRVEVQRGRGRKRLHRVAILAGVLAVLAGAYGATRTPFLDVDRIDVVGATQTPTAELLAAAAEGGVTDGAPLLDVDEGAAARSIEALPWVADATVRRDWPSVVAITVTERVPVAVVAAPGGGWAVVSADGVVVARGAERPPGLVEVRGAPEVGEPGTVVDAPELVAVAAALPEAVRAAVAAVEPGADPEAEPADLVLHDGGRVLLGPADDLETKLMAVATVLAQVDLTGLATLDVRVPGAPVLTRR